MSECDVGTMPFGLNKFDNFFKLVSSALYASFRDIGSKAAKVGLWSSLLG